MTAEVDLNTLSGAPPAGQAVVDGLVNLLDLEAIEENIFRGVSPQVSFQRVFGGQVAGQALVAAGRTVEAGRAVHSLHSYFIRPGDPAVPIIYTVERVRDGHSFSVRRVVAVQHGQPIFTLSASFQLPQGGIDHSAPMPDVPRPESLPTLTERFIGFDDLWSVVGHIPQPFDIRYVDDPPWVQRAQGPRENSPHRIWLRTNGVLPADPLVHVCAVTFASDMNLLDSVLIHHGLAARLDPISMASLDHAMWFHRGFRADEWLLYISESPSAAGGRGLATGRFFTQDGRHVVSVAQEGMIRLPNVTEQFS
ncbi:acyl-CoA thioesterase II [Jatrophihabitans telluris]|uniref:Acyl-CoA thioesterase II n=1 Tax=Jatrophihabitans telluris TaxID=2038343 RepID=A0ABY4QTX9_9ACTN|nr:acyl-CoA thioesterase II [Jatrophihabitans telluris]UQX87146.1 acyl-CoA thioesterase II [Jatrophihabitans telluris]